MLVCRVKNASSSPPQVAAEPESALSVPILTLGLSSFIPWRGKAAFGGEGYTVWVFKKVREGGFDSKYIFTPV